MLPVLEFILCLTKDSKTVKLTAFSIKTVPQILFLLFFSINNTKEKLYDNVQEMINFSLKTSIQKYPTFCSWYNVFSANVSDFNIKN
jgi:hypothetical protein